MSYSIAAPNWFL
jgi:hypothetical protein